MKTARMLTIVVLALGLTAEVANADFTFGTPTKVPNVNSSYNDLGPEVSADGLSLYFCSDRPGGYGDYDLYVATRATTDDKWGTPVNLGSPPNSQYGAWGPSITADGLELYFTDGPYGNLHPGGYGESDVWVTKRATKDDTFGPYVNLGANVNSQHVGWVGISADGLSLYITSHRPDPVRIGACDLYVATRQTADQPFGVPVNLVTLGSNVNGPAPDQTPDISLDGLTLFWGYGLGPDGVDLMIATRKTTSEPFGPPVRLPDHVNTSAYGEVFPSLSPDGSTLYFSSNRPLGGWAFDTWQVSISPVVDFNGDGIVDSADMCIMVDYWGTDNTLCDIGPMPWGDGIVDVQDLVVLAEHLFEEIPPVE